MKDVILACKKCPELAQVSSFCPFVRKSRASPKTPYRPERRAKGPPETQRFKAPAMHTGAETHLASQTREHTPCTQTIDGLHYSTQCFYVAGFKFIFENMTHLLGYFSFGNYFFTTLLTKRQYSLLSRLIFFNEAVADIFLFSLIQRK